MATRVSPEEVIGPGYFGPEYQEIKSLAPVAENLDIPSDHLIMLSQIRAELSADRDNLKVSIRSQGLIHPISEARMTADRRDS